MPPILTAQGSRVASWTRCWYGLDTGSDLAPDNRYLEWMTNIKAQKHTLDGAYSVHVFLGPVDEENVALWPAAPTHVGTFAPLG